jgi:hypothetical protein
MHSRASFALITSALIAGITCAEPPQPVEWKVSDGGNGHWYQLVLSGPITGSAARVEAERRGGHLVTATTQNENALIVQLASRASQPAAWVDDPYGNAGGPWLGGYQPEGASSSQPWGWVTGESWSWTGWAPGEPNGGYSPGRAWTLMLGYANSNYYRGWADATLSDLSSYPLPVSFIVEWDTDCNGDGIVDFGQIQSGQLQDDNKNNVPDVCEYTVTGVIPVSGASSGGTSVIINGTNFPQNPAVLIGGSAATNVVRVSANRITAVTPAGLPGMTSVTVGNWVQPNAFYYRPECGSDLDQDGEVTAADIAIVLLDFGPCYATATSTQPEDSTPFMLREQADSAAPRSR